MTYRIYQICHLRRAKGRKALWLHWMLWSCPARSDELPRRAVWQVSVSCILSALFSRRTLISFEVHHLLSLPVASLCCCWPPYQPTSPEAINQNLLVYGPFFHLVCACICKRLASSCVGPPDAAKQRRFPRPCPYRSYINAAWADRPIGVLQVQEVLDRPHPSVLRHLA